MTSDDLRSMADTSSKAGFHGHAKVFRAAAAQIDRLKARVAELERQLSVDASQCRVASEERMRNG